MTNEPLEEENLNDKLDSLAREPRLYRKFSVAETKECPVYNSFEDLWMESDAQLRERIKEK